MWQMYLSSACKKGGWSPEEDHMLIEAHKKYGNRWTEIAKIMPGRTDNAVKNRFTSLCKKQAKEADYSPSQSSGECYSDEIKHTYKRSRELENHYDSITSNFSLGINKHIIYDAKQQLKQFDDVLHKENLEHERWISLRPGGFVSVDEEGAAALPGCELSAKVRKFTRQTATGVEVLPDAMQENNWRGLDWVPARGGRPNCYELSFCSVPSPTAGPQSGNSDSLVGLLLCPLERNLTAEQPKFQSQSAGGFSQVRGVKQFVSPTSKFSFLKSAAESALSPLRLAQFLVDGMPSPQFSDGEKQFLVNTFSDCPGQHPVNKSPHFRYRSSPFRSPFRQLSFSENLDHSTLVASHANR
ncbi:hypothetical protein O6H91_18G045000 [Diphasiastrum complanatum]|uniref:Uncharacterized protein n=1 Tax=Diphasiastrum complanatum TaxID=34168 RepID=A0ACC2B0H9_DIPCM|nr:hypothetical protein O6H91_18G045000 [Diphasiastrum complanatum]